MCTFVETDDLKVIIDPGAALGPSRYGLPPHPLEWEALDESVKRITKYAKEADVLIITHYHWDHFDTGDSVPMEVYRGKTVFIKHPRENINRSQRVVRAPMFLRAVEGLPKKLETADGREFEIGRTKIKFSKAVYHGTNPKLGYVVECSIACGEEKFLHTSDVEGPSITDQVEFILNEKPHILTVDFSMTYMLGYRYSVTSLKIANENIVRVINETPVRTIMLDHHFVRDLLYKSRIKPIYEAAKDRGVKIITAAEYVGKKPNLLEARRKELFEKHGGVELEEVEEVED
jgi:hypothetical protein